MKDSFLEQLLENVTDDDNKKYENVGKVMFLVMNYREKTK